MYSNQQFEKPQNILELLSRLTTVPYKPINRQVVLTIGAEA